jgi:hypothetical protein
MISNTTFVGAGLTVIGVLLVSDGTRARTTPSLAKKETVAGIVLTVGGLATTAYSLMSRARHT